MTAQKFRKKPVVIEAMQWDGTIDTGDAIRKWAGINTHKIWYEEDSDGVFLEIRAPEGWRTARPGDWIIKGVKGEFYPCKPAVFEATYEKVDAEKQSEVVTSAGGQISQLLGKTLVSIIIASDKETVQFRTTTGDVYRMYHHQDCCESVRLEEVVGELSDLLFTPITEAEESSNSADIAYGSQTWTFYKLGTAKGFVTLRWLGESNGYYSESVDFEKVSI